MGFLHSWPCQMSIKTTCCLFSNLDDFLKIFSCIAFHLWPWMQQLWWCSCPRRTGLPFMNSFFKERVIVAKKDGPTPKYPELADKNMRNLCVMKPCTVSQIMRLREGTVCLETFLLVTYQRVHPVSLWLPPPAPWDCTCHFPPQLTWEWQAKVQRSGEWETCKTHTEGGLCSLVLTRKPRLGLGQQPNSNLKLGLVLDVVKHLSKVWRNYFMLNELVVRK